MDGTLKRIGSRREGRKKETKYSFPKIRMEIITDSAKGGNDELRRTCLEM